MIKKIVVGILLFISGMSIQAQNTTMNLPNGSFETWSIGQGYSVPVMMFSLPVYSDYTYPTNWGFPTYPVNETYNFSGTDFVINTDIPLIMASESTSNVPDSAKAVKLESFKLSDIIAYTIYNVAYPNLDSEIVNMTIPSILVTGNANFNTALNLVSTLFSSNCTVGSLLTSLENVDFNSYVIGGIALNGFEPTTLSGKYKYASAVGNDNGGILILGTHYNNTTHRREVVGGGFNKNLSNVSSYTSFEVVYHNLSEYVNTPEQVPDSLVVLLISSCNDHREQGSALYLDQLVLNHGDIVIDDPCNDPTSVYATDITPTTATIYWQQEGVVQNWEYSYGPANYTLDPTATTIINTNSIQLTGLTQNTAYDLYVRANCEENSHSEWVKTTFQTLILDGVTDYKSNNLQIYPNPANGICTVSILDQSPAQIQLYSCDGKQLQTISTNGEGVQLKLSESGIFFILVQQNGNVYTKKIINL